MRARGFFAGGARLALLAAIGGAAASALAGCDDVPAFECGPSAMCDPGSMCIDASCARPDGTCPSGYRWGDTAGDRAEQCAVFPDIAMEMPDLVDPNCGNGKLEPDEDCDDSAGVPCPTRATCDDGEPCSTDDVVGKACHRECSYRFDKDGTKCSQGDGGALGKTSSEDAVLHGQSLQVRRGGRKSARGTSRRSGCRHRGTGAG